MGQIMGLNDMEFFLLSIVGYLTNTFTTHEWYECSFWYYTYWGINSSIGLKESNPILSGIFGGIAISSNR